MSKSINNLVEQFLDRRQENKFTFNSLVNLISEQMNSQHLFEEKQDKLDEALQGAKERDRVIRFPNVMPTEISVGQKPSSQDRAQFELWMSNIGMSGGSDESDVARKLQAITSFFDNPEASLEGATVPETLSYLMFLNQFVWMLKEFNASVAGFLWEPFLASLFGGKSRQVPTSEGDIADIRIQTADRPDAPISLKILNEQGDVKGSFSDLVSHFADGGTEMRYVVVTKQQSGKEKAVSSATFYEFNIAADNFFDWIGNLGYTETLDKVVTRAFKLFTEKGSKGPFSNTGGSFKVKHATVGKARKALKADLTLAKKVAGGRFQIVPEVAKNVNLRTAEGLVTDGFLEPGVKYEVDLAQFTAGGKGGATLQKGYEPVAGLAGKDTNEIWGGVEGLAQWSSLAANLNNPQSFFKAVRGDSPEIEAAPGWTNNKQFHITPTHFKNLGEVLGVLKITEKSVENVFRNAAERMNDDLVVMFNSLASLTDNIGRFFLANCGDQKCTDKDAANRHQAGVAAMDDAKQLEGAVVKSVKSTK
jgi:hypothetical protein